MLAAALVKYEKGEDSMLQELKSQVGALGFYRIPAIWRKLYPLIQSVGDSYLVI